MSEIGSPSVTPYQSVGQSGSQPYRQSDCKAVQLWVSALTDRGGFFLRFKNMISGGTYGVHSVARHTRAGAARWGVTSEAGLPPCRPLPAPGLGAACTGRRHCASGSPAAPPPADAHQRPAHRGVQTSRTPRGLRRKMWQGQRFLLTAESSRSSESGRAESATQFVVAAIGGFCAESTRHPLVKL